ncbi:hypothetical protein AYX14_01353 [Cryptococcus neoformans]|nr:hypothetical protein AYX15_00719 [Cryptococcus neoformans var. grubii]OWZ73100.1 hypothetical protein AYX14_01353 [Cryptococcus neoformans var. grubii]
MRMSNSIPPQFTGWAAYSPQRGDQIELKPHSYTPRKFEDDDVIIKVECCGLCGSDVHTVRMETPGPTITGHEIVGTVVKAGPKSEHKVGERVGFGGQAGSCRSCARCKDEFENYCPQSQNAFLSPLESETQPYTQGGFSDYYQAKGHFAIKIPDEVSSVDAAPLLCAGVTVFTPLKHYKAGPSVKVGVVGIGGLGHVGLQFAKATGAHVTAISSSSSKRDDAAKLGADAYLDTSDEEAVKAAFSTLDLIICTSYQDNMPLKEVYLPLLRPLGNIVILGLAESGYPTLGVWDLLGKSVTSSMIGSPKDHADMFAAVVKHNIRPWVQTRPMAEASKAFTDFRKGVPKYRFVLTA